MRRLSFAAQGLPGSGVYRVVGFDELASTWQPDLRFAVQVRDDGERAGVEALVRQGLHDVGWLACESAESGDVITVLADMMGAVVLYRESDRHHALQLTNRCNSHCLMCSQPPTPQADGWRVEEALQSLAHMRKSPQVLGLSGGEPLLLGADLRKVMDAFGRLHPDGKVEVLTNGRLLVDPALASSVLDGLTAKVTWLVPLYGHADFIHDFVVQAPGAFEETIAGLLELQMRAQPIQLRIVLIQPVLQVLPELCRFIGMNLPFVREVALMGCEPIGFALANRALCAVDLQDWVETLEQACTLLERHRLRPILMNVPLCCLPRSRWPSAHRSISDWKNVYAPECGSCAVREQCTGLFAWHEKGWKPTRIRPILEEHA